MSHASALIEEDILAYLDQHENKDLLRFLTCGSVDDGKSTLIGRLLFDSKLIFEDHLAALHKDSERMGNAGESLDLALLVCVAPDQYAGDIERALHDAFSSGYRRDGGKGFFHPDNFSFGEPVRLSRVVAAAMGVPGVHWVGMRLDDGSQPGRFTRLDQPGADYIDAGEIPIGIKEVARLDNDPNAPDNGRIHFDMRGGL